MSTKTLEFLVTSDHPDINQARFEARYSKLYKNSITAVTRNYYFWKRDHENADLSISASFGIDVTKRGLKKGNRLVDFFSCKKNVLAKSRIYGPIREQVSPDLHSKICQALAREVGDSWSSYWGLRDEGYKASIPGYSKGYYGNVIYNKGMFAKEDLKQGYLRITTWSQGFKIPDFFANIQSAELVPVSSDKFRLTVKYESKRTPLQVVNNGTVAALDYGDKLFATMVFLILGNLCYLAEHRCVRCLVIIMV